DVVTAVDEYVLSGKNAQIYGAHVVSHLALDAAMTPTLYETWTYDAKGATTEIREYGPGPDGVYGTMDDVVASINAYANDASSLPTPDLWHIGAGSDGVWDDADDPIGASIVFVHDQGRGSWALAASMPGPDGKWGTSDDVFDLSLRAEYDAGGRPMNLYQSSKPGPAGVVGTSGDGITLRLKFPCRGVRVVSDT